jgi:hypothetical protein
LDLSKRARVFLMISVISLLKAGSRSKRIWNSGVSELIMFSIDFRTRWRFRRSKEVKRGYSRIRSFSQGMSHFVTTSSAAGTSELSISFKNSQSYLVYTSGLPFKVSKLIGVGPSKPAFVNIWSMASWTTFGKSVGSSCASAPASREYKYEQMSCNKIKRWVLS